MEATIVKISKKGIAVFETENYDYGILEFYTGNTFEFGDGISGNLHEIGNKTITKIQSKELVKVYIHECQLTKNSALRKIQ